MCSQCYDNMNGWSLWCQLLMIRCMNFISEWQGVDGYCGKPVKQNVWSWYTLSNRCLPACGNPTQVDDCYGNYRVSHVFLEWGTSLLIRKWNKIFYHYSNVCNLGAAHHQVMIKCKFCSDLKLGMKPVPVQAYKCVSVHITVRLRAKQRGSNFWPVAYSNQTFPL